MREHQHVTAGVLPPHLASPSASPAKPTRSTVPDAPAWEDLRQAADCIQWIDGEGRLLATNRRGLARLGIAASEATGKPWSLVWGAAADVALDAAIARGEGRFQASRQNAAGELSWWDVLVTPIRASQGTIVRLLAIGRDITVARKGDDERGRALARERAARSHAERTTRMTDEFMKELSHELRTPLNAILGWLDLIKQDRSPAALAKALEVIDRNARRQVQMLDALRDMSRIVAAGPATELSRPSVDERQATVPTLLRDLDVLIVDDESDALDLLSRVLEDAGARVTAATTAPEALTLLEQGLLPHFIVSDIGLPGLDGYQFMQRVRNMPGRVASTPAAAVTALARPEDRRRALLSGYQAHLPKPVDFAELVATIVSLTGRTAGGGAGTRT
jgi:PAS domain S-box-containing protein